MHHNKQHFLEDSDLDIEQRDSVTALSDSPINLTAELSGDINLRF